MKNIEKNDPNFPVVGIGASAGGLFAFESFFASLPVLDTDISFVLVQHLPNNSPNLLTDIIKKFTTMKVFEVEHGMTIQPRCVYVIPCSYDIKLKDYSFELIKHSKETKQKLPIDFFFHSLGKELKSNSIAIILSGMGSDGARGIETVKENGGLVFVQDVKTADYASMPESAIETGFVDYELSLEDIGKNILYYFKNKDFANLPATEEKYDFNTKKIFTLLQKHTGHDFSMYKPSIINRRISKCMDSHKITSKKRYVELLEKDTNELLNLMHELLINVTSLFRDKTAFDALEKIVIPKLFIDKEINAPIRIWVAGCSSGEEAYSIAILLKEYMDQHHLYNKVQIFASDIDKIALNSARNKVFSKSIEEDVTKSRLSKFFLTNNAAYSINKTIRDMIIFSDHDIIKDPPFLKLDLISCRNVMIYMNNHLQNSLILQFHYALYPKGILFLGNAESVGDMEQFYNTLDAKNKIYQYRASTKNKITLNKRTPLGLANKLYKPLIHKEVSLKKIVEQALVKHFAPTLALVDEQGDILYLLGETSKYLLLPQGDSTINNIERMIKAKFKDYLLRALESIKENKKTITLNYGTEDITVLSVVGNYSSDITEFFYLIIFENQKLSEGKKEPVNECNDESTTIKNLRAELKGKEKFLEEINEKLKLSNQELTTYNEEIQSMNEELQSTNEELDTSREELQSLNEELSVLNSELETKVTDLGILNNDMNNLIAGTQIGTIFVDLDLNILRFTPKVKQIIHLIQGDIGRYLGDIASDVIDIKKLITDTQNVLNTLLPKEREIETENELLFFMSIQPYRTIDNIVEGAVISFVNITDILKLNQKRMKTQSKKDTPKKDIL
jgi:two-component system CheB/CheR fusion protein